MEEELKYEELISRLADPDDPLWGGSLAYIEIEEALALLEKILTLRIRKNQEAERYTKIKLIANIVRQQSHEMITKDGDNFRSLRKTRVQEEKDKIVKSLADPSIAFITNISLLENFLSSLYLEEKTSLRFDLKMIHDTLEASYRNLCHILLDELTYLSDSEEKNAWVRKADELLHKETLPLLNPRD